MGKTDNDFEPSEDEDLDSGSRPGRESEDYFLPLTTVIPELRFHGVMPSGAMRISASVIRFRLLVSASLIGCLIGSLLFIAGGRLGLGNRASAWVGLVIFCGTIITFFMESFKNLRRSSAVDNSGGRVGYTQDMDNDEESRTSRLILQYHDMVKRQANSAHRSTQVAMFTCLVVLVAGAAVAIRSSTISTQVVVGGLAALGGTLSAYLSATFMATYNKTLAQLNFFFGQPLVNSYLLTAERLSHTLSDSQRDRVLVRVVDRLLSNATITSELLKSPSTEQVIRKKSREQEGKVGGSQSGIQGVGEYP